MSTNAFFSLIHCKRGFTLVELLGASFMLAIIMIAMFSFFSFILTGTAITQRNSEVHNEMRLMITHIKKQLVGSVGVEIIDVDVNLPANRDVLFKFDSAGCYAMYSSTSVENYKYQKIDHLDVKFERKVDAVTGIISGNILVVTLTNDTPDTKYYYELRDEIWLQNLDHIIDDDNNNIDITLASASGSGHTLLIKLAD